MTKCPPPMKLKNSSYLFYIYKLFQTYLLSFIHLASKHSKHKFKNVLNIKFTITVFIYITFVLDYSNTLVYTPLHK